MKLSQKILITKKITLLSGVHIGDSKESVEIGGVDSPVVRRKDNNQPYLPGSSLKGKIRSLLEIAMGENANSNFKEYSDKAKDFERLFGSTNYPSRLIVRDANLTSTSAAALKDSSFIDMPYSEIKFENVINRINGTAEHPRQIERVPAGAEFEVQFIINIVDETHQANGYRMSDKVQTFVNLLESGIKLLEDDYLGGSGSRGYGRVKFSDINTEHKTANDYLGNGV